MLYIHHPDEMSLPWGMLETMVKGVAGVDMDTMWLHSLEDAESFMANYGYNWHSKEERRDLLNIHAEAISFIEGQFLTPSLLPYCETEEMHGSEPMPVSKLEWERLPQTIPDHIKGEQDLRKLLLLASQDRKENDTQRSLIDQSWACAILKVMHTLCHIENSFLTQFVSQARSQILSRFDAIIERTDSGAIILGQPNGLQVRLAGYQTKDEKTVDSTLIKLLCKRENVAEEVFDMVGIRLITETTVEALLVLEILRQNMVIISPNIIPGRSRNTLIDFDELRAEYESILSHYDKGVATLEETRNLLAHLKIKDRTTPTTFNAENQSSLPTYRSLHITERQLIRYKAPFAKTSDTIRFFFPYEIQILDSKNFVNSLAGDSAHSRYKHKQRMRARRRVLLPVLRAHQASQVDQMVDTHR